MFCFVANVSTVIFDNLNVSFLNKNINLFNKSKTVAYVNI